LNGCSTSVLRSSAAKQWFQQLAQKKSSENYHWNSTWTSRDWRWSVI